MLTVYFNDKVDSTFVDPESKITEIGVYQFMAFLSDVGGILKITGLLYAIFTGYHSRRWIKTKLRKVHRNMDYILSYEGLSGLFDDVQKLKRIMLWYVTDQLNFNN